MQLLYYQAPISAVLLSFVVPFFEPIIDGPKALLSAWSIPAIVRN